jgi:hypothetical protein
MAIKLALLKSGEYIISDIKEGIMDDKIICFILENPCSVIVNGQYAINDETNKYSVTFNRWPIFSKDVVVQVLPDWIATVVEPLDSLKKLYINQVLNQDGEYETDKIVTKEEKKNEFNQNDSSTEQPSTNSSD